MRFALAVLCIGAVIFLLSFLAALVKESVVSPPRTAKFYLAKFNPSRRRGKLVVIDSHVQKREVSTGTDNQIAC